MSAPDYMFEESGSESILIQCRRTMNNREILGIAPHRIRIPYTSFRILFKCTNNFQNPKHMRHGHRTLFTEGESLCATHGVLDLPAVERAMPSKTIQIDIRVGGKGGRIRQRGGMGFIWCTARRWWSGGDGTF